MPVGAVPNAVVTATSDSGESGKGAGSDQSTPPGGRVAPGAPENVSGTRDPGMMEELSSAGGRARESATVAPTTCSGSVENRFVNRTRSSVPPVVAWRTLRTTVWARGEGGLFATSTSCGEACHVDTHGAGARSLSASTAPARVTHRRAKGAIVCV